MREPKFRSKHVTCLTPLRRDWWVHQGAAIRLVGRHWPQHASNTLPVTDAATGTRIDNRRYCMWDPAGCGRVLTYANSFPFSLPPLHLRDISGRYCEQCNVPLCIAHFRVFHEAAAAQFPAQVTAARRQAGGGGV